MSEKTLNNLRTIPENPVKAGCDGGILVNNSNDKVGTFIIAGGTASVRISCKSGTFTFVNSSLDEACKAAKACYDKEIAPLEAEQGVSISGRKISVTASTETSRWKSQKHVTKIRYICGNLVVEYSDGNSETLTMAPAFTMADKVKLDGIEAGAQMNQS